MRDGRRPAWDRGLSAAHSVPSRWGFPNLLQWKSKRQTFWVIARRSVIHPKQILMRLRHRGAVLTSRNVVKPMPFGWNGCFSVHSPRVACRALAQKVRASRLLSKFPLGQLRRCLRSFALPGLFNCHSLLEPDCGLGAQPLQRLKIVSENLNELSQAVEPPRFDSPYPLAAPHYAEKRLFLAHAGIFRSHDHCC